jgi:moderate conductance mechanosensitive channel
MMSTIYVNLFAIPLLFGIAFLLVRMTRTLLFRLVDIREAIGTEHHEIVQARARRLVGLLAFLAYALAAAASVSLILSASGVQGMRWDLENLGDWFLVHGVRIIVILLGAMFVTRAGTLAIVYLQHRISREHGQADLEWQRRASTVGALLSNLLRAAVFFVSVLMLLRELSIDIMPILTGAGIAGLAIGFGAQNLVRDVISGFFIILEDQVRVGDIARINNITGTVERIKLRTILLRDDAGAVQVFQAGAITSLANLSKQFAFATVDVRVGYTENIDRVLALLKEIGEQMASENEWAEIVLAPLEVGGVESIADGANIRARFKTLPLVQGKVANELRKRVLTAFADRGIKLHTPVQGR